MNAANNVLDFEQFKKEQEKKIQEYNDRLLEDTKTINYVDDLDLKDVRENKNLKISAKKISDKYKKIRRKRKPLISTQDFHKISKTFVPTNNKKEKKQRDKATLTAARKISRKYKKL